MEEPVLNIPSKRFKGESTVVSVRLPGDMVRELDGIAARTGRNRNEIVLMCLEFALDHLETPERRKEE